MRQIVDRWSACRKSLARHWATRLAKAAHADHICYFGAYVVGTHEVVVWLAGGAFVLLAAGWIIGEAVEEGEE